MFNQPAQPKKPLLKVCDGALEISVWKNDGDNGPWYSVTHRRSYKQGEECKEADSCGQDDILPLCNLLDMAHTWILNQRQAKQQAAA